LGFLWFSWDFLEDSTVLLRSVLAAAGGALILAVGLCSPVLATTPEMPDGQQPPAVEQVEPKPAEPAKKPDCVTNETAFKQNGEQPVFEVALENSCDMRLKCTVDLTVMGSRGVAQGRGTLVLGPAAEGQTTRKIWALKVKSMGGMASMSFKCAKI
jgi:hypothetical protein